MPYHHSCHENEYTKKYGHWEKFKEFIKFVEESDVDDPNIYIVIDLKFRMSFDLNKKDFREFEWENFLCNDDFERVEMTYSKYVTERGRTEYIVYKHEIFASYNEIFDKS